MKTSKQTRSTMNCNDAGKLHFVLIQLGYTYKQSALAEVMEVWGFKSFFPPQTGRTPGQRIRNSTSQMCMVYHALKSWCALLKKPRSTLRLKSEGLFLHGSMETFSGMDLGNLSLATLSKFWWYPPAMPRLNSHRHCNANETLSLPLRFNHWFDGMALMHQFRIEGGTVTYMSRFLNSDSYKANAENDRIVVSEFGTLAMPDPCKNFFQRFLSRFEMQSKNIQVTSESKTLHQYIPWTSGVVKTTA